MRFCALRLVRGLALLIWGISLGRAEPPFSGTIFLDPNIIQSTDPTRFLGLTFAGRGERRMFDRRVNGWVHLEAFLFKARFERTPDVEIQVNPEFAVSWTSQPDQLYVAELSATLVSWSEFRRVTGQAAITQVSGKLLAPDQPNFVRIRRLTGSLKPPPN